MTVLIVSRSENKHADTVEKSLIRRGEKTKRYNVDAINTSPPLVALLNHSVETERIQSVFVHHAKIDIENSVGSDNLDRQIISGTWKNWMRSMEAVYTQAIWMNKPSTCAVSANILSQLSLADKIGLRVPDTLFTNEVEAVKAFSQKYDHIIVKPGPLGISLKGQRILTRIVTESDINNLNILYSPGYFQEYTEKSYELRIHVIGEKVLSCRIESQANDISKYDWRRYNIAQTPHYAHVLDTDITKKCIALVKTIGLELGIIDMIVTPDGEHVFLECNSQGHWIWIEALTGLSITETIVTHLMN